LSILHSDPNRSSHEAIGVSHLSGDRTWLAWAHNNLGNGLLTHGELTEASEHFHRAQAVFVEIGMPDPTPVLNQGWVYLHHGQRDQALEQFSQAFRITRRFFMQQLGAYGSVALAVVSPGELRVHPGRSDGSGEFAEGGCDAKPAVPGFEPEFIVAAPQVLDEGMPCDDRRR
jgi:hypothetical protein